MIYPCDVGLTDRQTDRRTDKRTAGRARAYSALSMSRAGFKNKKCRTTHTISRSVSRKISVALWCTS